MILKSNIKALNVKTNKNKTFRSREFQIKIENII